MPAKVRQCYAHGLAFVGTALRGQVPDFCQNPRNMCENTYHLMISIATQQIHVTRITPITSARAVWFGDRTLKPFVSVLLVFLPKGVPCSDGTQIQPNCHWFPGSFVSILSWCLPSSCCMIKDYSSVSVGFYCMPLASNLRKQAGGNPGHSALVISLVFDVWGFANGVLHRCSSQGPRESAGISIVTRSWKVKDAFSSRRGEFLRWDEWRFGEDMGRFGIFWNISAWISSILRCVFSFFVGVFCTSFVRLMCSDCISSQKLFWLDPQCAGNFPVPLKWLHRLFSVLTREWFLFALATGIAIIIGCA